jgi:ABC-type lipoprotein export system ATPase subunit
MTSPILEIHRLRKSLGTTNSVHMMDMLTGIQKKHGMTLFVMTHEDMIANGAQRHIRIRDGTIVQRPASHSGKHENKLQPQAATS